MVTFFAILLILLIVNVGLILFSNTNSRIKVNKLKKGISKQSLPKIYTLDKAASKYKNAI